MVILWRHQWSFHVSYDVIPPTWLRRFRRRRDVTWMKAWWIAEAWLSNVNWSFLPNLLGITQSEIFLNDHIITWLKNDRPRPHDHNRFLPVLPLNIRFMTYLVARGLLPNKRLLLFVILPILILFPHIKCHRTHFVDYDVTLWWLTGWWRHFFTWFLVKWCLTGLVPTILCLKNKILKISIFQKIGLFWEILLYFSKIYKNNVFYLFDRLGAKITFKDLF